MTSALVIALSLAGFGLLVFGERMGLGPQLAAYGVMAILGLTTLALAFASTSARLARFIVGRERASALGLTALVTALVLFGLLLQPAGSRTWVQAAGLMTGLVLSYVAAPLAMWRNFVVDLALHGDRDPGTGTRGALPVLMVCSVFLCLLTLFDQLPQTIDQLAVITGGRHHRVLVVVLGLIGLVVVLGGLFGLQRIAKALVVIAFAAAVVPAGLMLASRFLDRFDIEALRQAQASAAAALSVRFNIDLLREIWPAVALGIGLGITLNQPAIAIRHRVLRGSGLLVGFLLAALLAVLIQTGQTLLKTMMAESILAVPPSQWPLFVFDEALHGWLTVCGNMPEDALAAARACGQATARAPLDAHRFAFEAGLDSPALALSQGWPLILGFIWALLIPLFNICALAFLLHAAASGLVERILFRTLHPKALRAWRLAMVRLGLMALLVTLYLADRKGLRLDPVFVRWALAGLTGVAIMAIVAYRFIQLMQWVRVRRQRKASPPASEQSAIAAPQPEIEPAPAA